MIDLAAAGAGQVALKKRFEHQHLGLPTGRPVQREAGRDHLRLVDDEEVARSEDLGQVAHVPVFGRFAPPVDQQASGIARLDGVWAIRSSGRS